MIPSPERSPVDRRPLSGAEAEVMRKLLLVTIVLTVIINVMTGIFVGLNV